MKTSTKNFEFHRGFDFIGDVHIPDDLSDPKKAVYFEITGIWSDFYLRRKVCKNDIDVDRGKVTLFITHMKTVEMRNDAYDYHVYVLDYNTEPPKKTYFVSGQMVEG